MLPIQIMMMAGIKPHTVSFSPYSTSVANGTHNFSRTVTVTDGSGTFTYLWSWFTGGTGMTLSNTTTATVSVAASGTNVLREGELRCTVTDTSNGNLAVSNTQSIGVTFGTPA